MRLATSLCKSDYCLGDNIGVPNYNVKIRLGISCRDEAELSCYAYNLGRNDICCRCAIVSKLISHKNCLRSTRPFFPFARRAQTNHFMEYESINCSNLPDQLSVYNILKEMYCDVCEMS